MSAPSPQILVGRVKTLRKAAAKAGRDPRSIQVFATVTPIIGRIEEEAKEKYEEALRYANHEAGLAFWSGTTGIDRPKQVGMILTRKINPITSASMRVYIRLSTPSP
ncbi:hypothetical protein A1O1_02872 [Capronia coronata CBS 617.96]|uniref:Uncharacterized protein n=1 Tax=Capronia coronata CBS 617.96 TaxID=1182541 RepID=W9YYW8_9EURO|nr:uncharacterized protein A1O1_02872 [Capronia coronata CBS 617.96]EXJ94476.1 hypothetical protein A1O1_02872 [Capronia coronata CBS 617.96]